jgi:hypothetical protein
VLLACCCAVPAADTDDRHVYSSWDLYEVDNCASIWLIKRFVDRDARFVFLPKERFVPQGTLFDIPEAALKRTHNLATYQTIMQQYRVSDPVVQEIGTRVFDIEINYWGEKRFADSREIEAQVKKIITESKDAGMLVSKSIAYFDELYERFRKVRNP